MQDIRYQDSRVECSETYFYQITAMNIRGESDRSEAVELIMPCPEFTLECNPPMQSVHTGASVVFIISLEGKHGFDSNVELDVKEQYGGITSYFNVDELGLSQKSANLTLSVSHGVSPGIYQFEVRGLSDKVERTNLTLEVLPRIPSTIVVNVPEKVQWDSSVPVSGKIFDPQDSDADFGDILVSLVFTPIDPGASLPSQERTTKTDGGKYSLDFPDISAESMGKWEVVAAWAGNEVYSPAEQVEEFQITPVTTEIVWDESDKLTNPKELEIIDEETISISGRIIPSPGIVEVLLAVTGPDGIPLYDTTNTSPQGAFSFKWDIDEEFDWEFVVSWAGNNEYDGTTSPKYVLPVTKAIGKAIIVQGYGKTSKEAEQFGEAVYGGVYRPFKKRKFADDDIYFLTSPGKIGHADDVTDLASLKHAITVWAPMNLNPKLSLYVYVLGHNIKGSGIRMTRDDFLTAAQLDSWLDQLDGKCKDITVIIEACYSGTFIAELSGANRTIITSSQADSKSSLKPTKYASHFFSRHFFDGIVQGWPIAKSFIEARRIISRDNLFDDQEPQLEADGNGVPNERDDEITVENRHIDGDYESRIDLADPPDIDEVSEDQDLPEGVTQTVIWARVPALSEGGNVLGIVVPPDHVETESDVPMSEMILEPAGGNKYERIFDGLTREGTYRIIIYAKDENGASQPEIINITVTGVEKAVDPKKKQVALLGDVKRDGMELHVKTTLEQNYPNPFNPDTWIPYQLAGDNHVVVRIYTVTGELVRELDIGHQQAGSYLSKEKAAHWDGCNEAGETVANGIYFIVFRAGDYQQIGRMIQIR